MDDEKDYRVIDVEAIGVSEESIQLANELAQVRAIKPPARRKPGRPMGSTTKKTPERVAIILEALAKGMSMKSASKHAGVSYSTVAEWRANDEEFFIACEKVISDFELMHVRIISEAAIDGDWKASAWLLSRRFAEFWAERKPEPERVNEIIIRWHEDTGNNNGGD